MDITIIQLGIDTGDNNTAFTPIADDVEQTQITIDGNNQITQLGALNKNGTSTKTVFDTGTEAWSSQTSAFDAYQRLQSQRVVFDNGGQQIKKYDPDNTHPYNQLDVTKGPDGQVTAAQLQLEQNIIAAGGSVGQIFGSALGRALAPNNQFAQLAVGTVAGLIGQKLLQTFTASLTVDASRFVAADFASVSGLDVTNAGLGAISSFLTAELGRGLGLTGFGAELFNGAVGGVTGSVLTQVATKVAAGYSFDAAVGFINWSTAATQAGYNVSAAVGSFLAHQFVHAESHEGAVGGQLFGAVGSALGISAAINASLTGILGFLIPGLGSFFGTIIGTLLGDALAGDPAYPKATHDVEILGSDTHFQNRLVGTDDHGNAAISQQMGDQITAIANSYLDAVHGAGIAYSGKVMTGYNAGAAPYQYLTGWFPNGTEITPHFANATDAIQEGVRELLVNTEVIGGDLLVKRAHQAFINGPHPEPTEISPDFSDLIKLGADLSVAQDYENYLNNREAINALIAANPDTAFAAGWIATFARVNDLGLNQVHGSDFLGGLVGYLDSVAKAGLGAEAANATIRRGADNSVIVEVKVANGVEVPGALSVFADQMKVTSDASGQTLQFTVDSGIVASGEHFLSLGATAGDGGNDFWIGGNGGVTFAGTGGHDVLVGGAANDVIHGAAGFDFIDGGAGNDYLFGEDGNDILRGGPNTDFLFGGQGDDTYVFNRGDGVDTVEDHYHALVQDPPGNGPASTPIYHDQVLNAGNDSLVFGPGISRADIVVVRTGNDLIVGVRDPAHPGVPFAQLDKITLQNWADVNDRIENFRFADGTTLDLSGGDASLAAFLVPFGATLSHSAVVEKSGIGTVVGTVAGFDLAGTNLTYLLENDAGGRFAIDASTGVVTVAGAIDYDAGHSWQIAVQVSDGTHISGQAFTINVIDIPNRAPVLSVPAGTISANAGQSLQVASWFTASDADNDALTYNFQDGTAAANSGYFALNGTPVAQGFSFGVTAAQLATLTFVAGAAGVADDLGVQLSDGHAVSAVGAFHVISINHAPTDATLSGGSVPENAPAGRVVGTVTGIDPDAGATFRYSLRNPDGYFAIDAATGVLTVAGGLLDYETATSWPVSVRIADQYGLFVDKSFAVNVTNVNEAPTDVTLFGGTVREHSANGSHVGTLIGADPDAGGSLSYFLYNDAGGRFAVNASTGVVTVKDGSLLDYANAQFWSIGVRVTDQGGLGYNKAVTVNVAAGPVNNPDGTSTVTLYDGAHAYAWSSFKSTYNGSNGYGSLLSQLGTNDNGSTWQNVFDAAHAYNWDHFTSTSDRYGHLLTQTTTYDDGTHSLLVNDVANTATWSSFTVHWDASWGNASLSDVALDNAQSPPLGMGQVWAALDTITWYANPYSVGPAPSFLLSDFNGDGRTDMLLQNNGTGGLYICEMNGAQIGVNGLSGTLATGWHYGGLGDFNADRKSDWVLLNDTTHQVYVCEMDGTTFDANGIVANVRADLGWYYKGLGDFNGDGKSDLILFNDLTHGVYICEMNGLAMGPNGLAGTIDAAAGWAYKTLGDFNGDGKADFLFLNDTKHQVKVWQMDGTELVDDQTVGTIDAAAGWRFKDTADFNGDGKTDLLLLNDANNHVMIWQMNGTAAATQVDLGAAPDHFHFADKGDFNGDGKTDLMFVNDNNGDVKVWQMNGTAIDQSATVGSIASGYHYAATGDFNGDGKTDMFFQNDATRAVQLWQMNGTEILQNSQMALLADGWHMVV